MFYSFVLKFLCFVIAHAHLEIPFETQYNFKRRAQNALPPTPTPPQHQGTAPTKTGATHTWSGVGSNTRCDADAGEVYHAQSSAQCSSLEQCKQSCQNEPACQSITYFASGWCSHFSTACVQTKSSNNAIAMQLIPASWKLVGANTKCDADAGEVYHAQSSAQCSNLEQCKKSCQDEPACQSITYFASGWCSHFSTACTKTKSSNNAIAIQLSSASSLTTKPTKAIGAKLTWSEVGSNAQCDAGAGEVYRAQSSGPSSSLEQCKQSCQDEPACQSITYFRSGWCSHFITGCTKTTPASTAVAAWRLVTGRRRRLLGMGEKYTWSEVGSNTHCNERAGEVYHAQSSGPSSSLDQCKHSCQDEPACQSITYFASGWCSHFSTACTKTKQASTAVAAWRLITDRRRRLLRRG